MDSDRLYQGYPLNKNYFFAPSLSKRTKTPRFSTRHTYKISNDFVQRITTPIPGTRRKDLCTPNPQSDITPDTLAYHLYRNSQNSSPLPIQSYFSRSRQAKETRKRFPSKSRDIGVQKMSLESILFPNFPKIAKYML